MHMISNQGKELLLPSCLLVSLLLFAREESIVIDFGNSLGVLLCFHCAGVLGVDNWHGTQSCSGKLDYD